MNQRLRRSPPDVVYTPIDVTSSWGIDNVRVVISVVKPTPTLVPTPTPAPAATALPDLVVAIKAPDTAQAGEGIGSQIFIEVQNRGTAVAPGTVRGDTSINPDGYMVDIILSTDTVIPSGFAVFSPNFSEDVMPRGGRWSRTSDIPGGANVLIWDGGRVCHQAAYSSPPTPPPGTYFLCAIVDPGNLVREANEGNNYDCDQLEISLTKLAPTPGAVPFRDHYYLLVTESMSWREAKAYAKSLGGYLVTIGDEQEHLFVANLAKTNGFVNVFIGLTDEADEGRFVWAINEPLVYTNWNSGEPNNAGRGDENYVNLEQKYGFRWNDVSDFGAPFVVEFEELSTGLVAYWPADGNASDIVGGNHGTLQNGATFAPGMVGQAFIFDGVDDSVNLASQPPISTAFTISAWVNFDSHNFDRWQNIFNNNQFFFRKDAASEGHKLSLFVKSTDGTLETRASSTTVPTPGTWYHVVGTWDGTRIRIYVDGIFEGQSLRQVALTSVTIQARIGRGEQTNPDANPFSGLIDEVKIYDRALTDAEIKEIYDAGSAGVRKPTGISTAPNFTVTSTADAADTNPGDGVCDDGAGSCTLRAAIMEANATAGADTITLPAGTYTLAIAGTGEDAAKTGDLDITSDLTITGEGADTSIIDGGGIDRVIHVHPGAVVAITSVMIRNGYSGEEGGGGVRNESGAKLSLVETSIMDNRTAAFRLEADPGIGGGILNNGTLSLRGSSVTGNWAVGGGGIHSDGAMEITESAIEGNTAPDGGGAIQNSGTLTMHDSTVSGNKTNDEGGGIGNNGVASITGSVFSSNTAFGSHGGGIANFVGTLNIASSTISGNTTDHDGGGIWNEVGSTLMIINSTLVGNIGSAGGGIRNNGGTVELINSIIANNLTGGDCSGIVTSLEHNLDSDGTCNLTEPTDLPNTDPLLGPLRDNGGPTETHALLLGSPAIDTGDDAFCPDTDQRGVTRPQGAACDIGAFEFEPSTTPTPTATAQATILTVNSTADPGDCVCNVADCSLREAINAANAIEGLNIIAFNIPGAGPHTIQPSSALPTITDPVIIDGYTQPGASPNINPVGQGLNTVLKIELDGSIGGTNAAGFSLLGGSIMVRGIAINRFEVGIKMGGQPGNSIEGNFIGTDVTGTIALGNRIGIHISSGPNNIIGGSEPQAHNLISGNTAQSVIIEGSASTGNVVQGNFIGTDVSGNVDLGNRSHGVEVIRGASHNTIGGPEIASGNTIAFNSGDGVRVSDGTGNAILSNAIFSNDGLGIDLSPNGVTPNDSSDGDTGANNLQNFPVWTSATTGNNITIEATLNSAADAEFRLEFFSNSTCDPSGYGEGETFLGSTNVTTDGSGNVSFMVSFPETVPTGQLFIAATATDPDGNTSEFSTCLHVQVVEVPVEKVVEVEVAPEETYPVPGSQLVAVVSDVGPPAYYRPFATRPLANYHVFYFAETLLDYDGVKLSPMIARSWDIDEGGITWKIERGVSFHDPRYGTVGADDVHWTFEDAAREDATGGQAGQFYAGLFDGRVVDDETIRWDWDAVPNVAWSWLPRHHLQGQPIVSKKHFDDVGQEQFALMGVGTNNYKILSHIADDTITLEGVRNHWRMDPGFETAKLIEVEEQATRIAMLRAGQADLALVEIPSLDQVADLPGVQYHYGPVVLTSGVNIILSGNWLVRQNEQGEAQQSILQTQLPWVGNPDIPAEYQNAQKVRLAMSMAIDRIALNDGILGGQGCISYQAFWDTCDPHHDTAWDVPYDPAGAKQLMAEAGYPDGFEVPFWIPSGINSTFEAVSESIAAMWKENLDLNVTIDLSPYPTRRPELVSRAMKDVWAIWIWGNVPNADGWMNVIPSFTERNNFNIGVDFYEARDFADRLEVEFDAEKAWAGPLREYFEYMRENMFAFGTLSWTDPWVSGANVGSVNMSMHGNILPEIERKPPCN